MSVGENIRRIRKEKGLTQKKLGELCGIAEPNIRKYELGKANPKIETISKIADALEVHIQELLDGYSIPTEEKQLKQYANGLDGLIAIIVDIYGKAEWKFFNMDGSTESYILVGEEGEQFVLLDDDMDTLYNSTKASIEFLINNIENKRTEDKLLNDLSKEYKQPAKTISMKKY